MPLSTLAVILLASRRGRLDEHVKQRSGVQQEHGLDSRMRREALEERARASVCPRELRVRREVHLEHRELLQVLRRRAVADEDRLWLLRAVSACCYAAPSTEALCRRWRCGRGRPESGEGVVDELADQTGVDTRADYRDVFL